MLKKVAENRSKSEGAGNPFRSAFRGIRTSMLVAAAAFATNAFAAEPPACMDEVIRGQIRGHLGNVEQMASGRRFVELAPVADVLAAPPASANQYATATTYISASRYCEGRAEFDAGEAEPVYWRIDQMMDDGEESTRLDICHRFFDVFEDGCKAFRPGE
ncbi:hypothetical protein [Pseudaminobacter soli (ex Li et al. 2025)]|uniref:hypothetical protein n=1 Tax=Pseudaminobacter soli (ex Li et al. 2025) TaxID=1295366 RepID=UPI002475A2A7|nr:hypothetical protein [Mesorhizobium soli]